MVIIFFLIHILLIIIIGGDYNKEEFKTYLFDGLKQIKKDFGNKIKAWWNIGFGP